MRELAGWIVVDRRRRPRFPHRLHRCCDHRVGERFFTRAVRSHLIAYKRLLLMMMMIFIVLGKIRLYFELVIVEILLIEVIVVLIS